LYLRHGRSLFDLSPLALCPELRSLNLSCATSDLTPLAQCASLHTLRLCVCPNIFNLQPLQFCGSLRALQLRGCLAVVDLSPLVGHAKLESLHVDHCREVRGLALDACLRDLINTIRSVRVLTGDFRLYHTKLGASVPQASLRAEVVHEGTVAVSRMLPEGVDPIHSAAVPWEDAQHPTSCWASDSADDWDNGRIPHEWIVSLMGRFGIRQCELLLKNVYSTPINRASLYETLIGFPSLHLAADAAYHFNGLPAVQGEYEDGTELQVRLCRGRFYRRRRMLTQPELPGEVEVVQA